MSSPPLSVLKLLLVLIFRWFVQSSALKAQPIPESGWPFQFPAREHCSKCGLCETTFVSHVKDACAFLENTGMSRIDALEHKVHGRQRDHQEGRRHEARFGVLNEPMSLVKGRNLQGAQWTGAVTSIAISMLEANEVDAVVCIAAASEDSWCNPQPILARTVREVERGKGVKPCLAPSLRVLDEVQQDKSIQRLLFCGVGCSVQAFRAVQHELDLDQVYVLGTNCADNSPTPEAANAFIQEGTGLNPKVSRVLGYEFMQDFRVHVKSEADYVRVPYFSLPGTIGERSIAKSCLSCFDYTNALADVVIGYMGAPLEGGGTSRMDQSWQTLAVRNPRGSRMVQIATDAGRLVHGNIASGSGSHEWLSVATVTADPVLLPFLGEPVPEKGMPIWLGNMVASALTFVGPKGLNFALYSIDYHILRNYFYMLHRLGEDGARESIPQSSLHIIDKYLKENVSLEKVKEKILQLR